MNSYQAVTTTHGTLALVGLVSAIVTAYIVSLQLVESISFYRLNT